MNAIQLLNSVDTRTFLHSKSEYAVFPYLEVIHMVEAATMNSEPNQKIEAYPIEIQHEQLLSENNKSSPAEGEKMMIKCKGCGKLFDSSFTANEIAMLPRDQNESGTLHLCPYCGQLSIYLLNEYTD